VFIDDWWPLIEDDPDPGGWTRLFMDTLRLQAETIGPPMR
jgi:hypothetical protein